LEWLFMNRNVRLVRRRVPLYVFLPVIVTCGVAGYVASIRHVPPASTAIGDLWTQSDPVDLAVNAVASQARRPLTFVSPPIEVPPALPIHEFDLPTPAIPAAMSIERKANMAPPSAAPMLPGAAKPVRSPNKARHQQRTARQRNEPSAAPTGGLKSIPLIGPMFSLLQ
jgi:hypothetical protein